MTSKQRVAIFMMITLISLNIIMPGAVLADTKKTSSDKRPLSEKENPELIGKRNINKGITQININSMEKEVRLGRQLAALIDQQAKFVTDPVIVEYINRLGQNIVLHSDAKVVFTIKIIDSNEVNAFALPGGFFYINKGLLLAADNEAEIVCVMAHEIGHVAARHATEQATKATFAGIGLRAVLILMGGGAGGAAANQGAGLLFKKLSRGAEEEADMLGLEYAWHAGYDPYAMISFFEKLQKKDKKKANPISILFGDHPPTADRIEKARALLVRFPEKDEYTINTSEFNRVKERLLQTTQTRVINRDDPTVPKRPTLKRRSDDPNDPQSPPPSEPQPDRPKPTLKRPDGLELF